MKYPFNNRGYKTLRQKLRRSMPPAEIILWLRLKNSQLDGFKIRRQYGIGKYVADFYCPEAKLVIEIDGESHLIDGAEEEDRKRQRYIESQGIKVIRFSNVDIYENLEDTIEDIRKHLKVYAGQ